MPLCATCGQASTAGCPGCELRQAAGTLPFPVEREAPTRLKGIVIDGALMLVPVPVRPDLCNYDVSIRLPVRPFEPVLCGCGRVQERSGAATCNYCDAQGCP